MSDLWIQLLSYLIPTIAAILTALGSWALTLLAKKLKIDLDVSKDAAVRIALRAAIGGAEEWAARKLATDGVRPAGTEKAAWVKAAIKTQYPKVIPKDLDRMLDEELGAISGVGATGERAVE